MSPTTQSYESRGSPYFLEEGSPTLTTTFYQGSTFRGGPKGVPFGSSVVGVSHPTWVTVRSHVRSSYREGGVDPWGLLGGVMSSRSVQSKRETGED